LGQWQLEVQTASEIDPNTGLTGTAPIPISSYRLSNPDPKVPGIDRFYTVGPGGFGQPLVLEEPSGGIAPPSGVEYADRSGKPIAPPTTKVVGCVFHQEDHTVALGADTKPPRFSFSNPEAPAVLAFGQDGTVELEGKKWFLRGLHAANKNRITGLVAFLYPSPSASGKVIVDELADVQYS
jgi:hypothetical protein